MDFPAFNKKKNFSQPKQVSKKYINDTLQRRQDTQIYPINEYTQPSTKIQSRSGAKIPASSSKYKISTKDTIQILNKYKTFFQQQLQQLLKPTTLRNASFQQMMRNLLQLPTFRIEKIISQSILLQRYEAIVQGLQYMISKMSNNQSLKEFIYVQNCQEFVLFFKSLFSKPYFFCNREPNRKIIEVLWENQLFLNKSAKRGIQNLKLWVYGIAIPSNPASITFHKTVLEHPSLITKSLKQINNAIISCNINKSDSDGNTPLMLAVRNLNSGVGIEKLVKNGCDIFCVPLTLRGNKEHRNKQFNQKYPNKIKIQLLFPLPSRRQQNVLEYLFENKKNFKAADVLYYSQINKIRTIKNSTQIPINIEAIPDCSFQIDWKLGKGFFQSCVKDVVVIFKQGRNLRVDFHIENVFEQRQKNQHYTFLIKCQQKPSLFLISHHKKKIVDLLKELISQNVKSRFEKYLKMGDSENQRITEIKSVHDRSKLTTQLNLTFAYENVIKVKQNKQFLASIKDYEKQLLDSNLINYQSIQKSQLQAALNSHCEKRLFNKIPQVKSKIFSSTQKLDIQWIQQSLNLKHIYTITNVLGKFYPILNKFEKIINSIFTNKEFVQQNMHKLLPQKVKLQSNSDFTIEAQIKNLIYNQTKLDENIFNVEIQAQSKHFTRQSDNENINSLKSTIIMDQMYSLSVSQFLGKTQALIQQQQVQYAQKFSQLLEHLAEQDEMKDEYIE